jgi:Zn-dependent peptidase ImmA (M78 family)/transcriptional regulator with XRE-family HTH domain
VKVTINPAVLEWAISDAGLSHQAVADGVDVPHDTLRAWIEGVAEPSLGEVRKLAALLKRSMSFFFLPAPPVADLPKVAFRAAPDHPALAPNPETRWVLRETHGMQEFLAWLTRELQIGAAHLPEIGKNTPAHVAAELARQAVGVEVEVQKQWSSDSVALREWRRALEALGVSVFFTSLAGGPKGFSISESWNPLIVVNTHQWNTGARIFTLAHELGHLLRGSSSSCIAIGTSPDQEERWCDRFAAAFLMPWDAVTKELATKHHWDQQSQIANFDVVKKLANRFKVSLTAATVRLIHQGVADGSLLAQVPATSNQPRPGGGGDPEKARRPHRRLQEFGPRTASILQRAVAQEIVTKHEALSRLGCTYDEFDEFVS